MTDYRALAAEELLAEYAGMTDDQKVAAIKAKMVTVYQVVSAGAIYDFLLGTGEWGLIEHFTKVLPTGTKLSAAGTNGTFTTLDTRCAVLINFVRAVQANLPIRATDQAIRTRFAAILDDLVTFAFISAASRTTLTGMASSRVSRAVQMGFADLTVQELLAARKVVAGG